MQQQSTHVTTLENCWEEHNPGTAQESRPFKNAQLDSRTLLNIFEKRSDLYEKRIGSNIYIRVGHETIAPLSILLI